MCQNYRHATTCQCVRHTKQNYMIPGLQTIRNDIGQQTFVCSSCTRFLMRGRTCWCRSQYNCRSGFLPLSQIIGQGSRPSVIATHAAIPPCLLRSSDSMMSAARRANAWLRRLAANQADVKVICNTWQYKTIGNTHET